MSTDKKTDLSKRKSKVPVADSAVNAKKKTETELTDEELGYVSGGTAPAFPKRTGGM